MARSPLRQLIEEAGFRTQRAFAEAADAVGLALQLVGASEIAYLNTMFRFVRVGAA